MEAVVPTEAASSPDEPGRGLAANRAVRGVRGIGLRARLRWLLAVGALLVVALAATSAVALANLISARHKLITQIDPANVQADQLLLAYVDQETGVRGYILTGDRDFLTPEISGLTEQQSAAAALERELRGQPRLLALVHDAEGRAARWQEAFATPAIAAVGHGSTTVGSEQSLLASKALFDNVRSSFNRLDDALGAARQSTAAALQSATQTLIIVLAVSFGILVAAGAAAAVALRRWVTDPISALGADARQVAAGEISHPIAASGPPDTRQLGADVEAMRRRITIELAEVEIARAELAARNADLARSNEELEQFAYVASHDLQEPLRKVTSFVQLLQQRYGGQLDERADSYIEFAVDGAKRMQTLIQDLLAFSRVGRTSTTIDDVDLGEALSLAVRSLAVAIEETGATVDAGPLPVVRGHPGLLAALWQNLLANSLKFRSDDPPVVSVEAVPAGHFWRCSVTDNGIGIDARFADKIFVIFQRLHSREAYGGTGIGLAMCKKIVEFHGGEIWLDRDHRPGTRISFTLPAVGKERPS